MRRRRRYAILSSLMALSALGVGVPMAAEPWTVPLEAGEIRNPIPQTQESIGRGAMVFAARCAVCHGGQARGDGPSSLSLWMPPTDLTSPNVLTQPDGVLFWKLTVGRGPMPNWDLVLSEEDRWHVINYLRAFTAQ